MVFDIDEFTSDEYEAFLLAAGQLNVQLLEGLTTRSRQTFPAKTGAIDAIFLPETHHLEFVHCEDEVTGLPADR